MRSNLLLLAVDYVLEPADDGWTISETNFDEAVSRKGSFFRTVLASEARTVSAPKAPRARPTTIVQASSSLHQSMLGVT